MTKTSKGAKSRKGGRKATARRSSRGNERVETASVDEIHKNIANSAVKGCTERNTAELGKRSCPGPVKNAENGEPEPKKGRTDGSSLQIEAQESDNSTVYAPLCYTATHEGDDSRMRGDGHKEKNCSKEQGEVKETVANRKPCSAELQSAESQERAEVTGQQGQEVDSNVGNSMRIETETICSADKETRSSNAVKRIDLRLEKGGKNTMMTESETNVRPTNIMNEEGLGHSLSGNPSGMQEHVAANGSQVPPGPTIGSQKSSDRGAGKENSECESEQSCKKSWTWSENTTRSRYMAIMSKQCASVEEVFTKKSVSTAIASAMMDTISRNVRDKDEISSADLELVVNLLLFGKQQNSNKSQCFTSVVGQLASDFRRKAMKNSVLHVMKGFVPEANMNIKHKELKTRPELQWLEKVIPTDEICRLVSNQKEKKGVKIYRRESKVALGKGTRDPSANDITEYVLTQVYSIIVSALNLNRKAFKKMFFGRIGYLTDNWENCGFKDVRKDVAAMWLKPEAPDSYILPSAVPDAKTVRESSDADKVNEDKFNEFVKSRKELMITVEHEVIIRASRSSKASASNTAFVCQEKKGDFRPFRRSFSLLGVALSMLSELCGVTSEMNKIQVLKYHSKSLLVCYVLAICVKRMVVCNVQNMDIGEPQCPDADMECDTECNDREGVEVGDGERTLVNRNGKYFFDVETDKYMSSMMAIVASDKKRILDRVVGGVSQNFWKENHIGGSEGIVGQVNTMSDSEDLNAVGEVDNVDPESLELDM